jgi:hypothetical protein
MAVVGNHLYVSTVESGQHIINISSPLGPTLLETESSMIRQLFVGGPPGLLGASRVPCRLSGLVGGPG